MHVLFVCTGNVCRSPIAERLAQALVQNIEHPGLCFTSAGTRAVRGHPIHPDAARALQRFGGDASAFAARQLTPALIEDSDLILTMTRAHRDAVLEKVPRVLKRTFTLHEAATLVADLGAIRISDLATMRPQLLGRELRDVPDPIGRAPEFHLEVAELINGLLPPVVELCHHI